MWLPRGLHAVSALWVLPDHTHGLPLRPRQCLSHRPLPSEPIVPASVVLSTSAPDVSLPNSGWALDIHQCRGDSASLLWPWKPVGRAGPAGQHSQSLHSSSDPRPQRHVMYLFTACPQGCALGSCSLTVLWPRRFYSSGFGLRGQTSSLPSMRAMLSSERLASSALILTPGGWQLAWRACDTSGCPRCPALPELSHRSGCPRCPALPVT